MKVTNPNPERELRAHVFGTWYVIPADDSINVDDPKVVTSLVEYGAKVERHALEAALEQHGDDNRQQNAAHASAPASEGEILERQRTVDVATGSVDEARQLKGESLDEALKAAGLSTSGTADEKRERLAEYRAAELEAAQTDAGQTGGQGDTVATGNDGDDGKS